MDPTDTEVKVLKTEFWFPSIHTTINGASGFGGMDWSNGLLEWNTGMPHLLPHLFEEHRSGMNVNGAEDYSA